MPRPSIDDKLLPTHQQDGEITDPAMLAAIRVGRRWRRLKVTASIVAGAITASAAFPWFTGLLWRFPDTVIWATVCAVVFVAGGVYLVLHAVESWRVAGRIAKQ